MNDKTPFQVWLETSQPAPHKNSGVKMQTLLSSKGTAFDEKRVCKKLAQAKLDHPPSFYKPSPQRSPAAPKRRQATAAASAANLPNSQISSPA